MAVNGLQWHTIAINGLSGTTLREMAGNFWLLKMAEKG